MKEVENALSNKARTSTVVLSGEVIKTLHVIRSGLALILMATLEVTLEIAVEVESEGELEESMCSRVW